MDKSTPKEGHDRLFNFSEASLIYILKNLTQIKGQLRWPIRRNI
jgi:hypothetical protein